MSVFPDGQRVHILVIEDDPAVATSLRSGLEREGYAVTWVDTGAAGMAHARERNPHLVLLDVRLPDLSGFDVCRQMRQLGLRQPIVMLTARRDEIDKAVWGYDADIESERTVNVHVRHLCEKIELDPSRPSLILTVPGIGYRLVG